MNLPPYPVFPELSNEGILLRAVAQPDLKDVMEISFYDAKPAETPGQAWQMQERIDRDYEAGNSIHWCIEDKTTRTVVGTCGYYRGFRNHEGELGCVLRKAFYGKGYMTDAMKLAIDFGFKVIGLQKIIAVTSSHNNKAIQLLERLQFQKTTALTGDDLKFELNKPALNDNIPST